MRRRKKVWLCEVHCVACEDIIYAQVGDQKIPAKQMKYIKCCGEDLRVVYVPIGR